MLVCIFPYSDHQDRLIITIEGGLDSNTNEFDDIENAATEKRRLQNFDDLQNELSGNEVGRITRFLSPDATNIAQSKNGKKKSELTSLEYALLNNTAFARAHSFAMNTLGKAENVAERALARLEREQEDAESDIQQSLNSTQELPNGLKAFRDKHGTVFTENVQKLDQATAAQIEWSGNEPSYETYIEQRKRARDIADSIYDVRVYQTDVLGSVRAELTNADYAGSVKETEALTDKIFEHAPSSIRAEIQPEEKVPTHQEPVKLSVLEPEF